MEVLTAVAKSDASVCISAPSPVGHNFLVQNELRLQFSSFLVADLRSVAHFETLDFGGAVIKDGNLGVLFVIVLFEEVGPDVKVSQRARLGRKQADQLVETRQVVPTYVQSLQLLELGQLERSEFSLLLFIS